MGFAAKSIFNGLDGLGNATGVAMNRTWHPVTLADFVHHGAANTDTGVSLEGSTFGRTVTLGGLEQTDHAGLHQVFKLDGRRQASHQVKGNFLDQRRVLLNELSRLLRT